MGFRGASNQQCYPVTHNPRGTCLIINNENFTVDLRERRGTLEDEKALERVFSKLGFEVQVHRDMTADDIRRVLKELGGQRFMKADVLVVCILSHGERGGVSGTDGEKVSFKELWGPFTNLRAPTLKGKPKLFFIQACQGSDVQKGEIPPTPSEVEVDNWSPIEEDSSSVPGESNPWGPDILISMSTVEGCRSFRNITTGSVYIQELCKQLETAAVSGDDIQSALTNVNGEVSRRVYPTETQISVFKTTLTKKLILKVIDQ